MAKMTDKKPAKAKAKPKKHAAKAKRRSRCRQDRHGRRGDRRPSAGRRAPQEPPDARQGRAHAGAPHPCRPPCRTARRPGQGSPRLRAQLSASARVRDVRHAAQPADRREAPPASPPARGSPPRRPRQPRRPDRSAVDHHRGQRQRRRPSLRLGQRRSDRRRLALRQLPDRSRQRENRRPAQGDWASTPSSSTSARTSTPRSSSGSCRPTPARPKRPPDLPCEGGPLVKVPRYKLRTALVIIAVAAVVLGGVERVRREREAARLRRPCPMDCTDASQGLSLEIKRSPSRARLQSSRTLCLPLAIHEFAKRCVNSRRLGPRLESLSHNVRAFPRQRRPNR